MAAAVKAAVATTTANNVFVLRIVRDFTGFVLSFVRLSNWSRDDTGTGRPLRICTPQCRESTCDPVPGVTRRREGSCRASLSAAVRGQLYSPIQRHRRVGAGPWPRRVWTVPRSRLSGDGREREERMRDRRTVRRHLAAGLVTPTAPASTSTTWGSTRWPAAMCHRHSSGRQPMRPACRLQPRQHPPAALHARSRRLAQGDNGASDGRSARFRQTAAANQSGLSQPPVDAREWDDMQERRCVGTHWMRPGRQDQHGGPAQREASRSAAVAYSRGSSTV
jgi:hypothetical protein